MVDATRRGRPGVGDEGPGAGWYGAVRWGAGRSPAGLVERQVQVRVRLAPGRVRAVDAQLERARPAAGLEVEDRPIGVRGRLRHRQAPGRLARLDDRDPGRRL